MWHVIMTAAVSAASTTLALAAPGWAVPVLTHVGGKPYRTLVIEVK